MYRFFRQFRKNLIEKEHMQRYLLYSIGEIVLVVIGILLALQVNSWNENRKDQEYLDFSLKEIHMDLKSDLRLIYGGIEPRLQAKEKGVKELYSLMLQEEAPADSIFLEAYRGMNRGFLLSVSNGSYQSLKSRGLDIIKNETLRNSIFNFYENIIPRTLEFIHGRDEGLHQKLADLEEEIFRFEIVQPEKGDPYHAKVPALPDYIHGQALHRILDLNDDDAGHKRYRLRGLKNHYFDLMDIMEEEMTRRAIPFIRFDSTAVRADF
ncbi:MAG: DUF6090 family protein [Robiginitalea sp.]